jgi:hypothetical protein
LPADQAKPVKRPSWQNMMATHRRAKFRAIKAEAPKDKANYGRLNLISL